MRAFKQALLLLLAMAVATAVSGGLGSARGEDDVFRFPRDRDTFFREGGITETCYIRFEKDGVYRRIVRAHMGVWEWDHGTWTQDRRGVIALRSDERVKPLRRGPLSIDPGSAENMKRLARLEEDVARFLEKDSRDCFPAREVEDAWHYTSSYGVELSAVDVRRGVKSVTREQLAELSAAWSKHLKGDVAEVRRATPIGYKDKAVLVWHERDSFAWFPDKPKTLKEKLKLARGKLKHEAKTGEFHGLNLYKRIDQDEFERESSTSQPFLFYHEMNAPGGPGS